MSEPVPFTLDVPYGLMHGTLGALPYKVIKDEYVSVKKVGEFLRVEPDVLEKSGFFKGIDYRINFRGEKVYKWGQCIKQMGRIRLRRKDLGHPLAEICVNEIAYDMGIDISDVYDRIRRGQLKAHEKAEDKKLYAYMGDYDKFIRTWFIADMMRFLPNVKMRPIEARMICDLTPNAMQLCFKRGQLIARRDPGSHRQKFFMKPDLLRWHKVSINKRFRRKELPEYLPKVVATAYVRRSLPEFEKMAKFIEKNQKGWFSREALDKWYMNEWCMVSYGEKLAFYTERNIALKFGRSYEWIAEHITGKAKVFTLDRRIITPEEFRARYGDTAPFRYPFMFGYDKESVDKIVAETGEGFKARMDIEESDREAKQKWPRGYINGSKKELQKRMKHMSVLSVRANRNRQREEEKKNKLRVYREVPEYEVKEDQFELGIKAAFEEKQIRKADERHKARLRMEKDFKEQQAMRRILGLDPDPNERLSSRNILKYSEEPQNVYIMYSLTGKLTMFMRYHPENHRAVTFRMMGQNKIGRRIYTPKVNSFTWAKQCYMDMIRTTPGVQPRWIVLVPGNSVIRDLSFADKLKNVPDDAVAVGAFGYEKFLPNGSWFGSTASYGLYGQYEKDFSDTTWVVGTKGVNGMHEVAVIDGPFLALRGEYGDILSHLDKFADLYDGDCGPHILNAAVSLILHRLGYKMMQISVDCSMCSEQALKPGTLEWNRVEDALISFGKTKMPLE